MRRAVLLLAAVACGGAALISFAASGQGSGQAASATGALAPRSPAAPATAPGALLAQGRGLFESSCASCHGTTASGIRGRGPSLIGVGALAADFYLQTGRMPLPAPRDEPLRTKPAFRQSQIRALVAFVGSLGGPAIPAVSPSRGSLARGQRLFALDCAGCHTTQAQGGIVTGAIAPSLNQATPSQVAEAIRIGPYAMPRFSSGELSDADVDSIARYLQTTKHPDNRGGWGIGRIGPIPEGMVAWLLAIAALLLVVRLIGERTKG
jgi:ubiquinol-cytochrome c reductase cytochrome c subunit